MRAKKISLLKNKLSLVVVGFLVVVFVVVVVFILVVSAVIVFLVIQN